MPVLSVPDVVVRELVHVHLELATVIDVHVGNEEMCDEPSMSLPTQAHLSGIVLYIIWGYKTPPAHRTNFYVFCFKKEFALL